MTKARTLADLLDSSGDVKSSALDNATSSLSDLSVTATASELNTLDGITATTAELNLMDGVTATTAEINYLDGVTSNVQTQIDGISSEVVDDTTPSLGGDLSTNGNDVNFGDNDKAQFGDGDLQIYHDGSNSYVHENGTGSLNILATDQIKIGNSANTEVYAKFNSNGNVELRHDNNVRLQTTSSGVDITSVARVGNSANPYLAFNSTATTDTAMVGYTSYQRGGTEKAWLGYGTASNNHFKINQGLNAPVHIATNGSDRLKIDGAGRITMPAQPGVSAVQYSGNNSSSGTYRVMYFNTFEYNTGSHYNSSNGRFTCPIAGKYLVSITNGNATSTNNNQYVSVYIAKNGSTKGMGWSRNAGYDRTAHTSVILDCAANDYIEFLFHNSYGEPPTGIGRTTMHIHLMA